MTLSGIPEQVHHPGNQQNLPPWAGLLFMLIVFFVIYLINRSQSGGGGRGGRGMWLGQPWTGSSGWGNSYGSGGGWAARSAAEEAEGAPSAADRSAGAEAPGAEAEVRVGDFALQRSATMSSP